MTTPDYDTDFYAWTQQQAESLRAKDSAALDVEHLAEEVDDLRQTERKAVRSQLRRLTSHLLKWAHQPSGAATAGRPPSTTPSAWWPTGWTMAAGWLSCCPRCSQRHTRAPAAGRPRIPAFPWRPSPRPARGRSRRCLMRTFGRWKGTDGSPD